MKVDTEELRKLCKKLSHVVQDVDARPVQECSFTGLNSGLVSVQSMFDQINDLVDGDHGLKSLFDWHIEEG